VAGAVAVVVEALAAVVGAVFEAAALAAASAAAAAVFELAALAAASEAVAVFEAAALPAASEVAAAALAVVRRRDSPAAARTEQAVSPGAREISRLQQTVGSDRMALGAAPLTAEWAEADPAR
jgi:hypothetical protein